MSESDRDTSKNIPVLKRKHVRSSESTVQKSNTNITTDSPDFYLAVSKAVTESINKAIPSIVEQVIKELESNTK